MSEIKGGGITRRERLVREMKIEFSIGGKVVIVEADGIVSVQVRDEMVSVPATVAAPEKVQKMEAEVPPPAVPEAVLETAVSDNGLFAKLVDLRRELAVAAKVPPYVVFKDATLREMVEKLPATFEAFGNISGVGQAKLEKYGAQFLAVIQAAA